MTDKIKMTDKIEIMDFEIKEDKTRGNKIRENEIANIGLAEIARFLYPLRNSSEEHRDLIRRSREGFGLNPGKVLLCSEYDPAIHFINFLAAEYIKLDKENAKPSMRYGESKCPYKLTEKGKKITQLDMEPIEIAKLLFPLKKTLGETRGALVERVKSELNVDDQHAELTVELIELNNYLVRDKTEGPWESKMDMYSLTEKGEATVQTYL